MKEYIYLLCPVVALIICQIIKFLVESIKNKKLDFERLLNGAGGMPSSHTTFSVALTMLIGYRIGFETPIFAVSLIFTCITLYDALGVRWESGKQAMAINLIFESIFKGDKKLGFKKLKEQLGHEPLEVLVGIFLGTTVAFLFNNFI